MSKLHNSLILFTLLILCMISVWIAPVILGIYISVMEFTEADSDPSEYAEDLYLVDPSTGGMIQPLNLRIAATHLYIHPASLARLFSPPRSFCD